MHINWGKVLTGAQQVLAIGAQFDQRIAKVNAAVQAVQGAIPDSPGADKKATAEAISDALLATDLAGLTADQQAQIKALRSKYIDLYVQEQKIVEQANASRAELSALLASFKKPA